MPGAIRVLSRHQRECGSRRGPRRPASGFGDDVADGVLVGGVPVLESSLKVTEVLLGQFDGVGFVVSCEINDPVGNVNVDRADVLGLERAQTPALDHRRASHAEVDIGRGDDHVAHACQRCVAGETATADDRHGRYVSAQLCDPGERVELKPGQERRVGVARASSATLGKKNQRNLELMSDRKESVLLFMTPKALRSREDGVVVRHHGDVGPGFANQIGVHRCQPPDDAVARRVGDEILDVAATFLGGVHETPVLLEAALVDEVGEVLASGSSSTRWTLATASGRASSLRRFRRARSSARSARSAATGAASLGDSVTALPGVSMAITVPAFSTWPGSTRISVTTPASGARTRCSIFIISTIAITVSVATGVPALTATSTTVQSVGTEISTVMAGDSREANVCRLIQYLFSIHHRH